MIYAFDRAIPATPSIRFASFISHSALCAMPSALHSAIQNPKSRNPVFLKPETRHLKPHSGYLNPLQNYFDQVIGGFALRLGLVAQNNSVPEYIRCHGLHILGSHIASAV